MSDVKDKISGAKDAVNQGKSALNGVQGAKDTITNTILSGGTASSSDISSLNSGTESALTSASSAVSNLNTVSSEVPEISGDMKNLNNSLNDAQSSMNNAKTSGSNTEKTDTSQTVKVVDEEDSEIYGQINISKEEGMAYDGNGLKHIMNIWLGIMGSEGISFTTLGTRRWAVDTEDNKVYGNAFLQRQSSKTFKTLDSDGKLYWLSDYNSRHYYGEAVDITGDLQGILDAVAKSDNVLDCMHKFGICMQIETREAGHSKGTHFHCSTDSDNPQTKFWGVVNRIRETNKMSKYTVVVNSDFYELETKNPVELA